jgi:uncharacterized protein YukE
MRGKDGRQIASEVGAELDYLSQLSRRLGVVDLVEDYFAPVLGQWNDLHEEAERWRKAGKVAETVTRDLTKPLGKLDSAWQGQSADSFVDHMQKVGLAGHDMSDAMSAMGDALDETAEGVRGIVQDMATVFRDAADDVSGAAALPLDGDARIIAHLDELRDPAKEMFESVRDVLEAFLRLCDGLSGSDDFGDVKMEHRYPDQNWTFTEPKKAAPPVVPPAAVPAPATAAAAAAAAAPPGGGGSVGGGSAGSVGGGSGSVGGGVGGGTPAPAPAPMGHGGSTTVQEPGHLDQATRPAAAAAGGAPGGAPGGAAGGGMGGGMMGGGAGGGQQGGDKEHKSKFRLTGSPEELLGKPKKTAPPVVGED